MNIKNGAIRILRLGGVDVFVHWTWAVLLVWYAQSFSDHFHNKAWIAAVLGAFIVMTLVHEGVEVAVGKLMGGTASTLTISFMTRGSNLVPPQRPWPIIITYTAGILGYAAFLGGTVPLFVMAVIHKRWTNDVAEFAWMALLYNVLLLAWTAAPVYPLNGGRVLRGLLWFVLGREKSLRVACVLGIIGTVGIGALALYFQSFWWGIGAVMIALQCVQGFKQARLIEQMAKLPRRPDVACPRCRQHPMWGLTESCACGAAIDPFETRGLCPECGFTTAVLRCPLCLEHSPLPEWFGPTGLFEVQATSVAVEPAALPVTVSASDAAGDGKSE